MEETGVEVLNFTNSEQAGLGKAKSNVNIQEISSLVLAYVGDAVYELYTREYLIEKGITNVHKLHLEAVRHVRASAQAKVFRALRDYLSEDEATVARRGRNAKPGHGTKAKGDSVVEYRQSTGFESLIGYLYLRREWDRLEEIIKLTWKIIEDD